MVCTAATGHSTAAAALGPSTSHHSPLVQFQHSAPAAILAGRRECRILPPRSGLDSFVLPFSPQKRLPRASQAEPSVLSNVRLSRRSLLRSASRFNAFSSEELGRHRRVATETSPCFERLRFFTCCL
ncbi:hypothetical protein NDU88_001119 [Pleurodeles waltl]|uniref:Uncharacterized protein n=1 Tax=Pleurodeles waltl TaxID=8319 RepID=A0AAV7SYJ2_PLEWA|nr:hypothetical protein NDU88_001119 [Pleurodeles waltl]